MARKPVFDDCMLCGECPCTCKKLKKAAPVKAARKKVAAPAHAEVPPFTGPPKCGWCTDEERQAGMPCACNVPPAPAPLSEPVDDVTPAPKADPRAAMRAAAARVRPVTPRASEPAPIIDVMSGDAQASLDYVMQSAIRTLEPLLHHSEKVRYAKVLNAPASTAERAAAWQARRQEKIHELAGGPSASS